jgi:hypothetical protein
MTMNFQFRIVNRNSYPHVKIDVNNYIPSDCVPLGMHKNMSKYEEENTYHTPGTVYNMGF